MEVASKRCTSCNEVKPLSDFHKGGGGKFGVRPSCKVCRNELNRKCYKSNAERVCERTLTYYYNNRSYMIRKNCENTRKRMNDPLFRESLRFRRLIKRYRSAGASKAEVNDHRLVSRETYLLWLDYQQNIKRVADGYVVDHSYPQAKLNVNDSIDRLIATNFVNLSPMSAADNASKGCKILPELLANQIGVANAFLATADLSYDEKLKFRFLTEMFTAYVRFKLGVE